MLKMGTKSIVTLIAVFALYTCIDPYTPVLSGYGSLLVIEGLITDENASFTVKLSRPECSDCEVTGTNVQPDFWMDLN